MQALRPAYLNIPTATATAFRARRRRQPLPTRATSSSGQGPEQTPHAPGGEYAAPEWKARALDRILRDRERARRLRAEATLVSEDEREYARGLARDLLEAFADTQGAIKNAVRDAREFEREARVACSEEKNP